ncbi:MAG: hypothetical protein MZW92_06250 [Comamonadaceae bacterium]|nr:hypothetical protein [Comamonadaceae bacterium]
MGTSQIALTAHLVMPAGPRRTTPSCRRATEELHERFGIDHVTLQAVREPVMASCSVP